MDPVGLLLYQEHAFKWFKDRKEPSDQFIIWIGSHRKGNKTNDMVYDSGRTKSGWIMGAPCEIKLKLSKLILSA